MGRGADHPEPVSAPEQAEAASTRISPFHAGEQSLQVRVGNQARMEEIGQRVIRDYMPDQHRELFEKLPFLVLGAVDTSGQPWAGLVVGQPGFVATTPRRMTIGAVPASSDPLADLLRQGAPVGVLGLEPTTRRRNRMNGIVASWDGTSLAIDVEQSFGNCPKYIQTRASRHVERIHLHAPQAEGKRLSAEALALIAAVDTFFIASHNPPLADRGPGVDVSHRGGKPGFIRVSEADGRTVLTVPDFVGNGFFNTLGNLALDSRCGLLFLDFTRGHQLQLAGRAEIIWDGPELNAFAGAERLLRLTIDRGLYRAQSLPFESEPGELSPFLAATGDWTTPSPQNRHLVDGFQLLTIGAVERESALVSSFWLATPDGSPLPEPVAGQFLPIAVEVPGHGILRRTYTISGFAEGRYRLSIKRERLPGKPEGRVSNFIHDHWQVGAAISAGTPQGEFVLDRAFRRPILMLAGGIGITPLLAMLRSLSVSVPDRRVVLITAARHAGDHPFRQEIAALGAMMPNLTLHTRYSEPDPSSPLQPDSVGLVDAALLEALLPGTDIDVYLCGPASFMTAMEQTLSRLGVAEANFRFEAFGSATRERKRIVSPNAATQVATPQAAPVTFARSGISVPFDPCALNLLEFAEDQGLSPPFSCRSGSCGSCATRKLVGQVRYIDPPSAVVSDDEVLLCCAVPDGPVTLDV